VAAEVFAAARRFGVAGGYGAAVTAQARVGGEPGESFAVGCEEFEAFETRRGQRQAGGKSSQGGFVFAADAGFDAQAAQQFRVERRVESVASQARAGVELLHAFDHGQSQARGGVHGQVKRHQAGLTDGVFVQLLHGQIRAIDVVAVAPQPRLRGTEPERLMAKIVGGN
jgi:hypothetical protein